MMPNIVALVPMRHHSQRVPGKNYRIFAGKPLYHYIITSLLSIDTIDEVVIDTDSSIIREDVLRYFPRVRLLERPAHLKDGNVPMNDVLLNDVNEVDSNFYLQTHSTNPLLRSETIANAIKSFLDNYPMYDSLFSVTKVQGRLWDGLTRAINHNPAILLRTQDLPPIYKENSCIYLFDRHTLEKKHNRIGERPLMFEIDQIESIDIDEELDFKVAELLYMERKKSGVK